MILFEDTVDGVRLNDDAFVYESKTHEKRVDSKVQNVPVGASREARARTLEEFRPQRSCSSGPSFLQQQHLALSLYPPMSSHITYIR